MAISILKRELESDIVSSKTMDKISLKSHRYWTILWVIFFIFIVYYEKNYSKSVVAQNVLESAIISWSAVSFSILIRLIKNDRIIDGRLIFMLIRKLAPPFSVLLFVEFIAFLVTKENKDFMIIFICSVSAVTTIYLALASLLEFSIWFNQPKNKR